MGQKINPVGLRLQVNRTCESRWFANTKEYSDLLHEDLEIRKFINSSRLVLSDKLTRAVFGFIKLIL